MGTRQRGLDARCRLVALASTPLRDVPILFSISGICNTFAGAPAAPTAHQHNEAWFDHLSRRILNKREHHLELRLWCSHDAHRLACAFPI